jgi:hypothetical protein
MKQLDLMTLPPRVKCCPKCRITKCASEFPRREPGRQSPCAYCKPCQRIYSRAHYLRNKVKHNVRRAEHQREYRIRNRQFLAQVLTNAACIDCGESDPIVLEFDHIAGKKRYDISRMIYIGAAIASLEAELAKCVVRCANCHRRKTARSGYWKGSPRLQAEQQSNGR